MNEQTNRNDQTSTNEKTDTNEETNINEQNDTNWTNRYKSNKPMRMKMVLVGRGIQMNREIQVWVVESKNINVKEW